MNETVPPAMAGQRLDRFVAAATLASRDTASEMIRAGSVMINGEVATNRARRLAIADLIEFEIPAVRPELTVDADPTVKFRVVWEDTHVGVIDKPAGLVVHPGSGNSSGTLVNGMLAMWPELDLMRKTPGETGLGHPDEDAEDEVRLDTSFRPGVVHRLDRGTSGLLMVAKTWEAYFGLVKQLKVHSVQRRYTALVHGTLGVANGTVDAPIGRSDTDATRMAVSASGKPAMTHYSVVQKFDSPAELTLIRCVLETGRTHQIRVHLAAIGHPVVADDKYHRGHRLDTKRWPQLSRRPFLHAHALQFTHPITSEPLSFEAELPSDLQGVLQQLS